MMRNSSSSALSLGDLAVCGLFLALSLVAGIFVVTVLLVATSPLVSLFPPDSGAYDIVLAVSLMWGVVTGCVVAVFTIGPYRRMHSSAQIESVSEAESVPLEMIGRPISRPIDRRRAANDRRVRAVVPVYEDDEDELLLEEEAPLPQRRIGGRRYRRA